MPFLVPCPFSGGPTGIYLPIVIPCMFDTNISGMNAKLGICLEFSSRVTQTCAC
jgi:hypothetical protein